MPSERRKERVEKWGKTRGRFLLQANIAGNGEGRMCNGIAWKDQNHKRKVYTGEYLGEFRTC